MDSKAKLASSAWIPSCFVRLRARLGTIKLQCPRHSMMFAGTFEQTQNVESIHTSSLVKIFQFHSKLGGGCFTSFFDGILMCKTFYQQYSSGRMRQKQPAEAQVTQAYCVCHIGKYREHMR